MMQEKMKKHMRVGFVLGILISLPWVTQAVEKDDVEKFPLSARVACECYNELVGLYGVESLSDFGGTSPSNLGVGISPESGNIDSLTPMNSPIPVPRPALSSAPMDSPIPVPRPVKGVEVFIIPMGVNEIIISGCEMAVSEASQDNVGAPNSGIIKSHDFVSCYNERS